MLVRLVLWPLQQNMMRNQLKMQRIQPEMQLVQQRYKNDPPRLQQEMMKVYAAHGLSTLSPITGCLPMLLPMPIFFALFFVFQNTIEFRGVPFLWMSDISLKDPFYVLPAIMAGAMFLLASSRLFIGVDTRQLLKAILLSALARKMRQMAGSLMAGAGAPEGVARQPISPALHVWMRLRAHQLRKHVRVEQPQASLASPKSGGARPISRGGMSSSTPPSRPNSASIAVRNMGLNDSVEGVQSAQAAAKALWARAGQA